MEKIQRYLRDNPAKKIGKKFPQKAESIFYAGSIFICWLPAYFSYYPGMISYNAPTVLYQILGADGEITRLHPPLHTFFFKAFIDLEMLSVPMMQIASVVYYNGAYLEDGIKTEIDKFIPYDQIEEKYNPRFAIPLRTHSVQLHMKKTGKNFMDCGESFS